MNIWPKKKKIGVAGVLILFYDMLDKHHIQGVLDKW